MLTAADIEGRLLMPLTELFGRDPAPVDPEVVEGSVSDLLDRVLFADSSLQPVENGLRGRVVVVLDTEIALKPFGDTASVVIGGGGGFTVLEALAALERTADGLRFDVTLREVPVALRVPASVLRPLIPGTLEPDLSATHLDIPLGAVTLSMGTDRPFELDVVAAPTLPLCMIGDTGIVIGVGAVRWLTPASDDLPDETPPQFTGLYLDDTVLSLAGLELEGDPVLTLDYAFFGRGGFTGHLDLSGLGLSGTLGGFTFGLDRFALTVAQNAVTASQIAGTISVPFFEKTVGVDLAVGDGSLMLALSAVQPPGVEARAGLVTFALPGVAEVTLDALGLTVGEATELRLNGRLHPLVAGLDWPVFDVRDLTIDSRGRVNLPGGWLDLPQQQALDLYGFQLAITRLGFGRSDDGGSWIGFSGALKLVEGIPAGASVEGLRVTWYDDGRPPGVRFDGVGVEFEVPDVLRFAGEVAMRDLPDGVRRFDGAIELDLTCLSVTIDGRIVFGTAPGYTFFAIYLDAELPAGIPLFATGLGLYGFAGLFALNMEPDKHDDEQWYSIARSESWYHRGEPGVTDLTAKWRNEGGSLALGAGVTIATLSDNGYAFSGRVLLAIVFPGPIVLLQGAANLLKERAKLTAEEPMFRALAVLDGRAGSFTFGLDARYRSGADAELIDVHGSAETHFSLADPSSWHVYIGRRTPTEQRIRADLFRLFEANAYLELTGRGLSTGAWIGIQESWTFGPAGVTVEAWIEGGANLSFKPGHLSAALWLHGKVEAHAFGIGVGLCVDARLGADVFTPFILRGEFEVTIDIPVFPDLSFRVPVQWGPIPADPPVPLPLQEIAIEHPRTATTWPLPADGEVPLLLPRYDRPEAPGFLDELDQSTLDQRAAAQALEGPPAHAPVVPLDGRPHLTFGRAVNDPARVGTTAQAAITPEWERIGDPAADEGPALVRHSLVSSALHRHVGGAWQLVAQTPAPPGVEPLWGSWAPVPGLPDGEGTPPTQTKLWLWSRNPFDYTRRTGGALDDWLAQRYPGYPCPPPLPDRLAGAGFDALPDGAYAPADLQRAVFERTFVDGRHRAVTLNLEPDAVIAGGALDRRGLQDEFIVGVKPSLTTTGEPCHTVRVHVRGGGPARETICARFADRAPGPVAAPLLQRPWGFAAPATMSLDIVEVTSADGQRIVGLGAGPALDLSSQHPFDTVTLTLTCVDTAAVRVQAYEEDGGVDPPTDLVGPFVRRQVVLTGTRLRQVTIRGPAGALVLGEVCGTADYALHATAVGDRRYGPFPVQGDVIEATGVDLDLVELHSVAPYQVVGVEIVCGPNREDAARRDEDVAHLRAELARWSQPSHALDSHSDYRVSVTTRVEVRPEAGPQRTHTLTQFGYFRTEGPPGLADLTLPANAADAQELVLRAPDGATVGVRGNPADRPVLATALNDLTPYVRQTLPPTVVAPGQAPVLARPAFRAYDLAVTFSHDSSVETMYRRLGRDLTLQVLTGSHTLVRDVSGAPVIDADHWTVAESLALTETDARWVESVDAAGCVTLDRSTIVRDARIISRSTARVLRPDARHEVRLVPLLLHEDFSGGAGRWTARDEGTVGGPSVWVAGQGPSLRQTSDIRGDPSDAARRGTVLLCADDPRLAPAHPDQAARWSDVRVSVGLRVNADGTAGVVVRDRGAADSLRLLVGAQGWAVVRLSAGTPTVLDSGSHALRPGVDHQVSVEVVQDTLEARLDGDLLAVVTVPVTTGRVGLSCWHNPLAQFADLRVDDLRSDAPTLFGFGLVTSRYATFADQLHAFNDEPYLLETTADLSSPLAAVALPSRAAPTQDEIRAFDTLPGASGAGSPPVERLDITRVEGPSGPVGFLLRGPEPLDWTRTSYIARRAQRRQFAGTAPGIVKLTDVTFATTVPNDESVTLLLRADSDLAGVVVERLDWVADGRCGVWRFVDESAGTRASWCALDPERRIRADARVAVAVTTDGDGPVGLVARSRGPGEGYRLTVSRPAGAPASARLVSRTAGVDTVLWQADVDFARGQEHTLMLSCEGDLLTAALDGHGLVTLRDGTHEGGQVGLLCADLTGTRFGDPHVEGLGWTTHHTFDRESRPLPTGTRVRLHSGSSVDPHRAESAVERRFLASEPGGGAVHLPATGVALRVVGPPPAGGHSRWFSPDSAYAPVELGALRNADGTAVLLARTDGQPLEEGDYRLEWTYHLDNRATDSHSAVLSRAGSTEAERVVLDVSWLIPGTA